MKPAVPMALTKLLPLLWLLLPHAQGSPDMYSCHPYVIPDSIPDEREFVGVRVGLDGASHLHHILLMECPGEAVMLCHCGWLPRKEAVAELLLRVKEFPFDCRLTVDIMLIASPYTLMVWFATLLLLLLLPWH
jgi:hypothetical protein